VGLSQLSLYTNPTLSQLSLYTNRTVALSQLSLYTNLTVALSQLFLYTNRTVGRSTKAVCGFYRLIKRSKTLQSHPTQFYEHVYQTATSFGPNLTHHLTIAVQTGINIEAKIIMREICTFILS
jgi:hypothetical protein